MGGLSTLPSGGVKGHWVLPISPPSQPDKDVPPLRSPSLGGREGRSWQGRGSREERGSLLGEQPPTPGSKAAADSPDHPEVATSALGTLSQMAQCHTPMSPSCRQYPEPGGLPPSRPLGHRAPKSEASPHSGVRSRALLGTPPARPTPSLQAGPGRLPSSRHDCLRLGGRLVTLPVPFGKLCHPGCSRGD